MVTVETEKAVFDLVETYNGRSIFTFRRYELKHDTDLNEDFRIDPLDAYDLLDEFTEKFAINPKEINFTRYFPEGNGKAEKPLTIQLLIDSARRRTLGRYVKAPASIYRLLNCQLLLSESRLQVSQSFLSELFMSAFFQL